ncbi:MAG: aminoglycoside phosphotransferase family protein [Gammaproteobacteria bacterium]|nr:aminoglycoside phosphotransferase family protein [Gammaproteobacteria bacterium]
MTKIHCIAEKFMVDSDIQCIQPFGNGLINNSWVIYHQQPASGHLFLQQMNRHVFKKPESIIDNLKVLHQHIDYSGSNANPASNQSLTFPRLIPTLEGYAFHLDSNNNYWRAFQFLDNTHTLKQVDTLQQAGEIGFALGRFHALVNSIALDSIQTTISDFHVTPQYLEQFDLQANRSTKILNNESIQYCLDTIEHFRSFADNLENARIAHQFPLRVIHGDPKRDNILFDDRSDKAISIIDLDTMQAGLIHYDIGDCMRSCCGKKAIVNGEDDVFTEMYFDIKIFEAVLNSYLNQTFNLIMPAEYDWFYDAVLLIPFELGLRFLTDYMNGNVYFKTEYPQQNLHKALQQFSLVRDIDSKKALIEDIINRQKQHYAIDASLI